MSPEQADSAPQPERRAFYTPPGPEAELVVRATLSQLADVESELRIVGAFLEHGAGFAAYLRLNDTDPNASDISRTYWGSYADVWASLDDLATDTIEALGWRELAADLIREQGIPEGALVWEPSALHGHLHEMYDFVELDGMTHAFHR